MTRNSTPALDKQPTEIKEMPHGGNRPGSGRPPGSRNKRTEALAAETKKAAAAIEAALEHPFSGDAHALLVALYKDETRPIEIRLEAAKAAIRYERPALAAVDLSSRTETTIYGISAEPMSMEEWAANHCGPDGETEH